MPYHEKLVRALFHLIPKGSHILQKYEQFTIGLAFERAARRAADPGTDTRDDGDDADEEKVCGDGHYCPRSGSHLPRYGEGASSNNEVF